jgi:hypothetical protein
MFVAVSLATSGANAAPCTGPGGNPSTFQTKCYTAVQIPGNPLRSFDISWVDPGRGEYYLADRSNSGIDIINSQTTPPTFQRTIGGFVGIHLTGAGAVNNNISGPDGVTTHGRWLYAGDGDSTLKVIDLNAPTASAIKQTISTGGTTRLDEMALNPAGTSLIAANNAEDPPYATLFNANGDNATSNVTKIAKILIDHTIVPAGFGLSIEQPTWDPATNRFYVSIPIIANNPTGCNYGQIPGAPQGWGPPAASPITCHGGMLVVNPTTIVGGTVTLGAYDSTTKTGVVPLNACSPNGITVGENDVLLLGCTPGNNPSDTTTLVLNPLAYNSTANPALKTFNYANIGFITGSDEVWFNTWDERYYLGASKMKGGAVLGVVDEESVLIESIPQSANSHSVAADSTNGRIFVPQVAPTSVVGAGGDTTTVGQGICGSTNGCVAVYNSGAL